MIGPFELFEEIQFYDLEEAVDDGVVLDLFEIYFEEEVAKHLLFELGIGETEVELLDDVDCLGLEEFWVELVYQLAGDAQEGAVYGFDFYVLKLQLEEEQVEFEDVS